MIDKTNTKNENEGINMNCETCQYYTDSDWSEKPCFACDGIINKFYSTKGD